MEIEQSDPTLSLAMSRVGIVLRDKWRLDRFLGMGGMAAVYSAIHRNGNRVAIKMLHPEYAAMPEARKRFLREGYAANQVGHPGAVKVLDDDCMDDGTVFLVMELLQGESVESRWERKGMKLGVAEVMYITDGLLDVLAAAHGKGIVHRDIKPDNVFISSDKRIKLLDFGIAAMREATSSNASKLTRAGAAMGTPAFMAPEQAMGRLEKVDAQTDLWSVGASMFTLLSGHWVHEADNDNLVFIAAATQRARSLATMMPDLPSDLVAIVDCALAYEKANRWTNAAAMQSALRDVARSLQVDLGSFEGPPPAEAASDVAAEKPAVYAHDQPSPARAPSLAFDALPKPIKPSTGRAALPKNNGAAPLAAPQQSLDFHLSHDDSDEPPPKLELWLDHYPTAGQAGMETGAALNPRIRVPKPVAESSTDSSSALVARIKSLMLRALLVILAIGVARFVLTTVNEHYKLFDAW